MLKKAVFEYSDVFVLCSGSRSFDLQAGPQLPEPLQNIVSRSDPNENTFTIEMPACGGAINPMKASSGTTPRLCVSQTYINWTVQESEAEIMMLANQSKIHWPRLLSGLLVTTVCALSVHAVMLQVLNVPFPVMSVVPSTFRFLGKTVVTLGLIIFLQLASRLLEGSVLKQWGVLALISAMLTETLFRGPFMDGYCTSAFTFAFVSNGPHLLTMALLCGIVATVARWLPSGWQKMLASVAITALMMFVVTPLVNVATAPLMKAIAGLAPQGEWCSLPYGPKVLIPAYLSFAEPVLACLAAAALVWNRLAVPRTMRFLQFILIILAIKNQLVSPFIYAAFAKEGFLHGLESEGQFALEALVLAALIGATWEWSVQPRPDVLPQGSRQEI